MKTKEELNAIMEEVETLSKKLAELNEEEFAQVAGGSFDSDQQKYFEGILNPEWAYRTPLK